MSLEQTYDRVLARHYELRDTLSQANVPADQFAKLSKEFSELMPVAEAILALRKTLREKADAESMLSDPEMRAEAQAELDALRDRLPEMEKQVQRQLLPKDIADERNAILEVRAGTGGDEAALFAALLF